MARHHLFIVGTGRAGTSMLVRYLAALGLDTHLAQSGETGWDEAANAGLEDVPSPELAATLPYVVKSPWFYEFVDQLLADPNIVLDAVILPVRDLAEAAASRAVLEMRAIHQATPWMATMEQSWESWGRTPGGVVYSVNPLDQARLLALGFHHVVQRLVHADIPLILLDFPRLVTDAEYLYRSVESLLPEAMTREVALAAHAAVADPAKVRVGDELGAASPPRPITAHQTPAGIDRIAIRRELVRLRGELDASSEALKAARAEGDESRTALETAQTALAQLREQAAAAAEASRLEIMDLGSRSARLAEDVERFGRDIDEAHTALAATQAELAQCREEARREAASLRSAIDIIRSSTSWRLTRPLRALGILLGR